MSSPIPVTLRLSGQNPLTRGSEKAIYLHPTDPALIVKVRDFRRQGRDNPLLDRLLLRVSRQYQFHWLLREVEASVLLLNRENPPPCPLPVAIYRGLEMTDKGPAVLADRICLPKHRLGIRLSRIAKKGSLKPRHVKALNVFVKRAMAWQVPMTDPNPANLVFGDRGRGPEVILVDGFGDYSLLRWRLRSSKVNDWINRKKFRMIANQLSLDWDPVTLRFSLRKQD